MDMYSVMCVRDAAKSARWYEVFFGRTADRIMGQEFLWQVGANAWIVIDDRYMRAERVGGSMVTFAWHGLDETLARLTAHGIGYGTIETYGNGVRHVEVLDPDGNSLSLAEPPA